MDCSAGAVDAPGAGARRWGAPANSGVTLTELLVSVTVVGILVSVSVPQYVKMRARSHWRHAETVLLNIHAAEQVYASLNGAYLARGAADDWSALYMHNPNEDDVPITFTVGPAGVGFFTATADGPAPCATLTVDQGRVFGGAWDAPGDCP